MTIAAVFGGSFNPPHVAHQMVCLYVLETQPVDKILVVPTFKHAFDKQLAPFDERLEMCRLAMEPLGPRAEVSDIERELGGEASRTLITLQALVARHPGWQFRLVIGADILREREKWYRWSDIEALAPPIIVGRAGYAAQEGFELPAISSTEIRARLGRGASPMPLVSRRVAEYIAERGLYR
jgi:nicotinate-nucleotide adenylyltransferase